MNAVTRGIKGVGRNFIRAFAITVILGVSFGLSLVMLIANRTIDRQIQTTMTSIGTTITVVQCGITDHISCANIPQAQADRIRATPHIARISTYITEHMFTTGTADTGKATNPLFTSLQDADDEPEVNLSLLGVTDTTGLASLRGVGTFRIASGGALQGSQDTRQAILSEQVAQRNHLSVGSTFTIHNETFTVSGLFVAGTSHANTRLVIIPLPTAQRLLNASGKLSGAVVNVDSLANLSAATTAVTRIIETQANGQKAVFGDQPVPTVESQLDQANAALQPLNGVRRISLYSLIGATVASALIMLLTMAMIVRERRREIGILKAIGLHNSRIIVQYMSEAFTFALGGTLVGILLGVTAGNPLTQLLVSGAGSRTTDSAKGVDDLRETISSQLGAATAGLDWTIVLYGAGAAILLALISSGLAAFVITKVRPAEVLRSE